MSHHHESSPPRRVGCLSRTVYIIILVALVVAFLGGSIYLLWFYPG
jgi:flagellar basal body-associated protein FliL